MKRSAVVLLVLFLAAVYARAQAVESATARSFRLSVGGMASGFIPNTSGLGQYGISVSNLYVGPGTYVDLRFSHWIQIEGEARWLRFNGQPGEFQDHYLIGPKVPLWQIGRMNLYGKAMAGLGREYFPDLRSLGLPREYVTSTALAFGGGVDWKLGRKVTFRPLDFEYQYWPNSIPKSTIQPFGVSVGLAYRVF